MQRAECSFALADRSCVFGFMFANKENGGIIMKLNEIVVDGFKTLGKEMILVSQNPYFDYEDGKRTDRISGYKYEVVLPEKSFEKVSIKIESLEPAFSDSEIQGNIRVAFDGLKVKLYQDFRTNQVKLTCQAQKIRKI